ncbi:MAG: AraC family transcriptional regulator [Verrucomicrobiales bacterium]
MSSHESEAGQNDALLRFSTSDPDEWVEKMSVIATGLKCSSVAERQMKTEITGMRLPDVGIFASTLENFRVQSELRPYYGVTIPLEGHSEFLIGDSFETCHSMMGHVQPPDRPFDAKMGESSFRGLQLCFDKTALDSFSAKLQGPANQSVSMLETLDMTRPAVQGFVRHARFIWSEVLRGGPILSSHLVSKESSNLLAMLLVLAMDTSDQEPRKALSRSCPPGVRKAEEYLVANLSNPISIADVAVVARMSVRHLTREFRRHRGTTIKRFIKARRLEAANRTLRNAEPGETNVTRVAMDLGFEQLGRFSADYREAFGELPSQTLAR